MLQHFLINKITKRFSFSLIKLLFNLNVWMENNNKETQKCSKKKQEYNTNPSSVKESQTLPESEAKE